MSSPSKKSFPVAAATLALLMSCPGLMLGASRARSSAQTPATANPGHFVGAITAIDGGTVTAKTDAGQVYTITIAPGIRLVRVSPGDKDLSKAQAIQQSSLGVGDRVLVRLAADSSSMPFAAISVIDIPQAEILQKQQQERAEWQQHGVGGLVKSVDPVSGSVVITSGAGATQKEITLKTSPATVLRRYAPDSVDYDHATLAPIDAIHVGDQLRALVAQNVTPTEVVAKEIVSGGFRNIAGVIASVNPSAMTVTLKDLATKKNFTIHISPTTQMRKLPEDQARLIAESTKPLATRPAGAPGQSASGPGAAAHGWSGKAGPGQAGSGQIGPAAAGAAPARGQSMGGAPVPVQGSAAPGNSGHGWPGAHAGTSAVDPQQMIRRAPAVHLNDLKKGEAVMLVATSGDSDVTAITLLAGVEPLLQSNASTQNMLLANWSMSSGGDDAAAQ